MSSQIAVWYDNVLNQMAAECYLEGFTTYAPALVKPLLIAGNNRFGFDRGLTSIRARTEISSIGSMDRERSRYFVQL